MKAKNIRQTFFDFFQSKQHKIVESAPIVLKNDPTLMFTNAGMNQFKDYFLGEKTSDNKRVADTQKCLRVSGKHNDLDEVGHDTYHHTMFEMLGNWSFGDYFKKEAIEWAWELLTEVYKIPKENIYVSIFEGDKEDGLPEDTEAYNYWKALIEEDRILKFDKKDNFWEMGDTGPCGPCSEIHVDIRSKEEKAKQSGRELVNADHPQVIEIWNLVFMQFLRKADKSLEPLKEKHIDTGMGFERLAMVLQNKQSNYDTDVFMPIINQIEKKSNLNYGANKDTDIAIRVVADHLRAVGFAIADGQLPSNNGAGYVIRRILRRAISYGYRFLNQKEAFIYELVDVLEKEMGDTFKELSAQKELIKNVIKEEENSFLRTLAQGLNRIAQIIEKNKQQGKTELDGKTVFELYDTYGFPLDLSELVAKKDGITIDSEGFEEEMQKQKQRGKQDAAIETGDWIELAPNQTIEFIGYDDLESNSKILKHRTNNTAKGAVHQVVLDKTPFYAESGGQVGDKGILRFEEEDIPVYDTKKENDLIVHFVKSIPKNPTETFKAVVNTERRQKITKNHTATHLLHQALRDILGTHVEQKGSYVGDDRLRFDFSHFSKLSDEELKQVETFVNQNINHGFDLEENRKSTMEEAKAKGAMALFGEKYGNVVRTIQFGDSVELCGGCHVKNTKDIVYFKIESESSIASGIRRIEAITGETAIKQMQEKNEMFDTVLETLKHPKNPKQAVEKLLEENQTLKKQLETFIAQQAKLEKETWKQKLETVNGVNFLAITTELDAGAVKQNCFQLKQEVGNLFLVIGSTANQKPTITVLISDNLVKEKNLNAGTIVRELAKEINGGGGGQAFFATAGGKKMEGLEAALAKAKAYI